MNYLRVDTGHKPHVVRNHPFFPREYQELAARYICRARKLSMQSDSAATSTQLASSVQVAKSDLQLYLIRRPVLHPWRASTVCGFEFQLPAAQEPLVGMPLQQAWSHMCVCFHRRHCHSCASSPLAHMHSQRKRCQPHQEASHAHPVHASSRTRHSSKLPWH